ncbi:hypothetical protein COCON_G00226450 [Conger conger]|uniref:NIDO domain-containing protein n=1 Tax=Conger conger TaxID=82655 RepID=A0A9Q1CXC8_CONCO|nr:hypothetical protein COCON_G00226450 [Conger conger]
MGLCHWTWNVVLRGLALPPGRKMAAPPVCRDLGETPLPLCLRRPCVPGFLRQVFLRASEVEERSRAALTLTLQVFVFRQSSLRFRSVNKVGYVRSRISCVVFSTMGSQGRLLWATLLGLAVSVRCVRRSELFPHGEGAGDGVLPHGNDQTQEVRLDKPVLFYDGTFDRVYVNTNGFVALGLPVPESEYLGNMPAGFGMIAALVGDLDTSDRLGQVYYRQDSTPATLRRAAGLVNRAFPEDKAVEPHHSLVVTWVGVAPMTLRMEEIGCGTPSSW